MFVCCSFPCAGPAPSETAGGKFTGRAQAFPLRLSASPLGHQLYRHPTRLTIRSSRPHVVASAACFTLRLHASAAPPQVGLTQALGGRKAFCKCAAHRLDSPASVGSARRTGYRRVSASFKSAGRAHNFTCALRLPASEAAFGVCSFSGAGPAPSETAGGKFAGRAYALRLRLSASPPGLQVRRHPTRLTIRSSRPRVVASATCLRYASTRPPPRCGAA